MTQALAEPKVRDAVWRLLTAALVKPPFARPRGWLLINAAMACAEESEPIRQELAIRRSQTEGAVRARLEKAFAEGELLATANVIALAKFIATFQNGLAVQQSSGAVADSLLAAVELAMRVLEADLKQEKRKTRK